jgi:dipeptidase
MEKRVIRTCTTLLVGKKAAIDGSNMIARCEDGGIPNPKQFVVVPPEKQPIHYTAKNSKVAITLPANPLRYTAMPDAKAENGIWGEAGINSENIAMSASETITTNSRVLGADPFVADGIGEEDLVTIVLPYIHSAKEGVLRLGSLLEQFGTYESNGIAFCDAEEIWYLETLGGHHWAAVRIPDDAYVIAPNRLNIDQFDFDSPDTLFTADLPAFIEKNQLNPDFAGLNLRHTFGSSKIKDTHYNTPRAWYVQRYFNPELVQSPLEFDTPFIMRANRKIAIEDVKFALSSHYQNTEFDPYGAGSPADKTRFRPIGINTNQELHILQIRADVTPAIAGIHWAAVGPNTFNAIVPFYANALDMPKCYRDSSMTYDPQNMYWLSCTLALLGDANYGLYSDLVDQFEQTTVASCRNLLQKVDQLAQTVDDVPNYLTQVNAQLAEISLANATQLLGDMVKTGSNHMKLRFSLND